MGGSPSQASKQGFPVTKATLMQINFSLEENKTHKWHQLKNVESKLFPFKAKHITAGDF